MRNGKIIFAGITFIISFGLALAVANYYEVKKTFKTLNVKVAEIQKIEDGDLIFQTSQSSHCEAVRIATKSKFSHCGIVFFINKKKYVFEAVQPVKLTPLEYWVTHGKDNKYVVKRLKNSEQILNPEMLIKMKDYAKTFKNKDYDLYFEWSDQKIYCSELIWKIYNDVANIELCKLQKLRDFDLENPKVKAILAQRYGNKIPLDEKVVAPSNIVNSEILVTIIDNY